MGKMVVPYEVPLAPRETQVRPVSELDGAGALAGPAGQRKGNETECSL